MIDVVDDDASLGTLSVQYYRLRPVLTLNGGAQDRDVDKWHVWLDNARDSRRSEFFGRECEY